MKKRKFMFWLGITGIVCGTYAIMFSLLYAVTLKGDTNIFFWALNVAFVVGIVTGFYLVIKSKKL